MIYFDLIMTLYEDFLISYYILNIFSKHISIKFLILTTLITTIETFIFNGFIINNLALLFILVLTWGILLIFYKKDIKVNYFIMPLLLIGLLTLSNIISFLLCDYLLKRILSTHLIHVITIMFSRILFFISLQIFYKLLNKSFINKQDSLKLFNLYLLSIIAITITYSESVIYGLYNNVITSLLLIEFILSILIAIIMFFEIERNESLKIMMKKKIDESKYSRDLYYETSQLTYKFNQEKHQFYYYLKQIENIAKANKDTEILNITDEMFNKLYKTNNPYHSNNPLLDLLFTQKLSQYRLKGFNIVYISNVNNIEILNNKDVCEDLLNYIDEIINYINDKDKARVQIHLSKKDKYIVFKVNVFNDIKKVNLLNNNSKYIVKHKLVSKDNELTFTALINVN